MIEPFLSLPVIPWVRKNRTSRWTAHRRSHLNPLFSIIARHTSLGRASKQTRPPSGGELARRPSWNSVKTWRQAEQWPRDMICRVRDMPGCDVEATDVHSAAQMCWRGPNDSQNGTKVTFQIRSKWLHNVPGLCGAIKKDIFIHDDVWFWRPKPYSLLNSFDEAVFKPRKQLFQ